MTDVWVRSDPQSVAAGLLIIFLGFAILSSYITLRRGR
jgi:hypothetical protein